MSAKGETVAITINGEPHEMAAGLTLVGLLRALELDPRKVAVERNLEIAPRSAYEAIKIGDGDRIEIVQFVGGG